MNYHFSSNNRVSKRSIFIVLFVTITLIASGIWYFTTSRFTIIESTENVSINLGGSSEISVTITNLTQKALKGEDGYYLSAKLYKDDIFLYQMEQVPLENSEYMNPITYSYTIESPQESGAYLLVLDIEKKGEYWLGNIGNDIFEINFEAFP